MNRIASAAITGLVVLLLAGCGGGGGDTAVAPNPPPAPAATSDQPLADVTAYSSQANGSLPGAEEAAAITHHSITLGSQAIIYTAKAGHLIARDPATGEAEASFFYVAYTADGALAASRPVTFFYNGGPGSATVWLHLGSYGPRRLATAVPGTSASRPFPLVNNAESLLDTTDLVFVNAVGTGLSTAIAPFTNQSFWGVDRDAAVMRDFIVRYLAVNERAASPKFLFGESYGGPRTAVLARLLQDAGVRLDGLVLQSPAMDYNSNCGVTGSPTISCAGYLPSYGAVGLHHGLVAPLPTSLQGFIDELRGFAQQSYAPAVAALVGGASGGGSGSAAATALVPRLVGYTGLAAAQWQAQFNLPPETCMRSLLPGSLLGRYDGRISALLGSPLAAEGDPSSTLISASFASAINDELRTTLRYTSGSTYVLLSNAIQTWDFSHAGRALPDTVPDLALALQQNPALRVLAISGLHDLATPFHQTELDLARLGAGERVRIRNYAGGHMSYLDDGSRPQQKADLVAFYRGTLAVRSASLVLEQPHARAAVLEADRAGTPVAAPAVDEPAVQAPLRDPWVPPRLLARPAPLADI